MTDKPGVVQRMEAELEELTGRIDRASTFLSTGTFESLPGTEQVVFKEQVRFMEGYAKTLRLRLGMICERLGL